MHFGFKKMHLKMQSTKWKSFYLGLNVLIEFRLSTSLIHTSCIAWSSPQKSIMVIRHLKFQFKCQRVLAFLCRQRHRLQCNIHWHDEAKRMRKSFPSHIPFVGFCTVCSLIKNVYRVYGVTECRWKRQKRFWVSQSAFFLVMLTFI